MNDTRNTAIAANIEALASILSAAFGTATQAREYMTVGQRNAAIGTIMEVEGQLADAGALLRAAIALHRTA
jgi:hypothetical protein